MLGIRSRCLWATVWALAVGYGPFIQSALASGEAIAVYLDPGNQQRENLQMADRMRHDLKNVLDRRGNYRSRLISAPDQYRAGQDEYLLNVTIVRYNSGSKAARIIVGFGAGTATLDIHYEFIDPRGNKLLSKDDGVATSLDWQRLARKLNENILAAVQQSLTAGGQPVAEPRGPVPAAPRDPAPPPPEAASVAPPVVPAPAPAVAVPTAPADPAERLRRLDSLRKEKQISESEYRQKRKEILEAL